MGVGLAVAAAGHGDAVPALYAGGAGVYLLQGELARLGIQGLQLLGQQLVIDGRKHHRLAIGNARMLYQCGQRGHPAPLELVGLRQGLLAFSGAPHHIDLDMVAQALAAALEIGGAHFTDRNDAQADDFGKIVQQRFFHQADIVAGFTGYGGQGQR